MRIKLMFAGTLVIISLLALTSGWAVRQLVRSTWSIASSPTPDTETLGEANRTHTVEGRVEKGTLNKGGADWLLVFQEKTKQLSVNSQTEIYIQGETLYRTPHGNAALEACAQERCPVYVVWSPQSEWASAIVVALSPARQTQFPDPDPAGKTPIPRPSSGQ
jgi:hypothetical protein